MYIDFVRNYVVKSNIKSSTLSVAQIEFYISDSEMCIKSNNIARTLFITPLSSEIA